MEDIDLKFISAYWCKAVAPEYEERFDWSWERAEEAVNEVGNNARAVLVALAKSAPDEKTAAYFAAGPLENYINLVIKNKLANEAAFITENNHLKDLLVHVWGDVAQLAPLAAQKDSAIQFDEPYPDKNLSILDIKDVMGFWCRVCSSPMMETFNNQYNRTMDKLLAHNTSESVKNDLIVSAPDNKAVEYLRENIFVMHR